MYAMSGARYLDVLTFHHPNSPSLYTLFFLNDYRFPSLLN